MKPVEVYSKSFGTTGFVEMIGGNDRILVRFDENISHWLPQSDLLVILSPEEAVEYLAKLKDES